MRSAWATIGLVVLVFLSTARSLENGFAFDDVPIIAENDQVHRLDPPWVYAQQSYWPPRNLGDAYRPLTVWGFAIQWAASGGKPFLFHAVNLALTVLATLMVFALGRRLVPFWAAWLGAALFAVHPVHVEATANVVGQAELWMTVFTGLGVWLYLGTVRPDKAPEPRGGGAVGRRVLIAVCLVLAAAAKEQGIVLLGLLIAADVFVISRPGSGRERLRAVAPNYILLTVAAVGFGVSRYLVLGDLGGGPPAKGLAGLTIAERTVAMLPVALEWLRLLAWPNALAAQYSPPGYAGSHGWSVAATAGLTVVIGLALLAVRLRRGAPVVAFGIAWMAIAILPVSNILFATGIVIAERTLLLPSVGLVLAVAGAAALLPGRIARHVAVALAGGLIILGVSRSYSRQAVWADNPTLFAQTVIDGPTSYRAFYVHGRDLARRRKTLDAIDSFERAAALYSGDERVFEEWGQVLRSEGDCVRAVPIFERGVEAAPTGTLSRSRLVECLLKTGRYAEAKRVADAGLALGLTEFKSGSERAAHALDSLAGRH
ncbi:MAG: tetratricopeptide repeat protein [Gemmatimonadota bacterium]